jgi:hypothetical protein
VPSDNLYLDLLAFAATEKPTVRLETRMAVFLKSEASSESLDSGAFAAMTGSQPKADYLLGSRRIVAELKTINSNPLDRTEQRLKQRLQHPDAPIVFGTVGISRVIEDLPDREVLAKMMVDMAGRPVRRHLQKANDQIAAIKERLQLPDAAGLLILMNDSEPMIDAAAVGYTLKTAFETAPGPTRTSPMCGRVSKATGSPCPVVPPVTPSFTFSGPGSGRPSWTSWGGCSPLGGARMALVRSACHIEAIGTLCGPSMMASHLRCSPMNDMWVRPSRIEVESDRHPVGAQRLQPGVAGGAA